MYGKRSGARYPIFGGLSGVGELPNRDPTDTGDYDPSRDSTETVVDAEFEAGGTEALGSGMGWSRTEPERGITGVCGEVVYAEGD